MCYKRWIFMLQANLRKKSPNKTKFGMIVIRKNIIYQNRYKNILSSYFPMRLEKIELTFHLFLFSVSPDDLLLRMGEYDLNSDAEPHTHIDRKVQIVASHPKFDPKTFEYDLALLRFYDKVDFQPNIVPICVPEEDTDLVGETAWVTGWGRLYEGMYNFSWLVSQFQELQNEFEWHFWNNLWFSNKQIIIQCESVNAYPDIHDSLNIFVLLFKFPQLQA